MPTVMAVLKRLVKCAGRPLGHPFLDKLFQLSVSVPRIGRERLALYWQNLLKNAAALDDASASPGEKRAQTRDLLGGSVTQESLQRTIDGVKVRRRAKGRGPRRSRPPDRLARRGASAEKPLRRLCRDARSQSQSAGAEGLVSATGVNQAVLFL